MQAPLPAVVLLKVAPSTMRSVRSAWMAPPGAPLLLLSLNRPRVTYIALSVTWTAPPLPTVLTLFSKLASVKYSVALLARTGAMLLFHNVQSLTSRVPPAIETTLSPMMWLSSWQLVPFMVSVASPSTYTAEPSVASFAPK